LQPQQADDGHTWRDVKFLKMTESIDNLNRKGQQSPNY